MKEFVKEIYKKFDSKWKQYKVELSDEENQKFFDGHDYEISGCSGF